MGSNNRLERRRSADLLPLIACAAALSPAVSWAAPVGPGGATDPLEPVNRDVFHFNRMIDRFFIRPAAMVYVHVVPKPIRMAVKHGISNLGEPAIFVNDMIQFRPRAAARTAVRFVTNSVVGAAGMVDIAKTYGLQHHPNDFGMTLARYGIKAGPYLIAPVVGPTTLRDAVGSLAGLAFDPVFYMRYHGRIAVSVSTTVVQGLQERADADRDLVAVYGSATDPYGSLRSYFLQNRQSEITGGKLDIEALPEFGDTPAPDATPPSPPDLPAIPPPAAP